MRPPLWRPSPHRMWLTGTINVDLQPDRNRSGRLEPRGHGDDCRKSAAPTANITVVEASTLLSFTAPAFGFLAGETVTVNGANSTDPALMGLTYQWTGTGGAAFTDSTVVAPGLTLPALLSASSAVYTLTLVVTDGLNQPSDPVMVTLNIDRPVMADAGVDQTATTGGDVTLNGGASVNHALASADPLTYSWIQTDGSPTVALTNETTSMPTFTAPTAPTVLTFNLTVSGSYKFDPLWFHRCGHGDRHRRHPAGQPTTHGRGRRRAKRGRRHHRNVRWQCQQRPGRR